MKKCVAFVMLLCCLCLLPLMALADEVVLVDNDYVLCKVTGYGVDWMGNFSMNLYLENKADTTTMFSIDNCCVDGYAADPFWAKELMPNSKANAEVSWSDLEKEPTLIEFSIRAYDSNDWSADDFCLEPVVLYPQGEENVKLRTYQPDADDVVLFDTDDAMMVVTGYDENAFMGYAVCIHLENKTDKTLMYAVDGATVNGFSLDPFWATKVPAGRCADVEITWYSFNLEENGITDISEIILYMRVYDSDDWFADPLIVDQYTINP